MSKDNDLANERDNDELELKVASIVHEVCKRYESPKHDSFQAQVDARQRVMQLIQARDEQLRTEAKLQGESLGMSVYNDAFHDLPAPDVESWFLRQRDRIDEELAELKSKKKGK